MLAHTVLSAQLPGCTSDSSCAAWAVPHFITVRSLWQWAVKLCSPLPHPAQSHAPRRDEAYRAVCPDQDIPSSDPVPGGDALCHSLSLAPFSYGDFCSTAQDPKILCQWRGRGAAASPGILAGTSHFHLHNGDCSTTTINPLWNIFRPGCADEGEMTGSLHIQTMQCLPAAATWCNWRSVGCFPREGSTDWVLWLWACWEQLLVQDTTILLPLNLFSFTAF